MVSSPLHGHVCGLFAFQADRPCVRALFLLPGSPGDGLSVQLPDSVAAL